MEKKNKQFSPKDLMFGKTMPNVKDIEVAILGVMLMQPKTVKVVKEIINEIDFYVTVNQIICKSIFEISEHNIADYLLVAQDLIQKGLLDEVGGAYFITKLTDNVVDDTNIKRYCLLVKQKSIERRLINFSSHVLQTVYEGDTDIFDMLIEAENKLKGINYDLQGMQQTSIAAVGMNVIKDFDERVYKAKNNIVDENAIFTGFKSWDEINGSLFPGL